MPAPVVPKVLLDASVPQWLRKELSGSLVQSAFFAGLDQLSDSSLLRAIEGRFDVLITLDGNLSYQQRIGGRLVAVIVLRVTTQTPEAFRSLVPALQKAIENVKSGEVIIVGA